MFKDVAHWVGIGLANLAAILDPGMFILGGGLSEAGELLLGPARSAYAGQLTGRGHRTPRTPEPDVHDASQCTRDVGLGEYSIIAREGDTIAQPKEEP